VITSAGFYAFAPIWRNLLCRGWTERTVGKGADFLLTQGRCYETAVSVAQRKSWTLAEFLAWEERQELRYEFDGVRPVAMVGGTLNHNRIAGNLYRALAERLAGQRCQAFIEGVKIEVAGRIRYPDVVVSCTPALGNVTIFPEPVVVFEVFSPSTRRSE
jgi:Uma2 family endonuclease